MIKTIVGDALAHPKGLIVHGCNCQGVMGAGIARSVREKYPEVFNEYIAKHKASPLKLGDTQFVKVGDDKYIVNAMIQNLYGSNTRFADYEAIATCFESINKVANQLNLDVIFPKIGAGLAGGDWRIISRIIDTTVNANKILYVINENEAPIHYQDVVMPHRFIGSIDKMCELSKLLGYSYFMWNDRIYFINDDKIQDTGKFVEDLV